MLYNLEYSMFYWSNSLQYSKMFYRTTAWRIPRCRTTTWNIPRCRRASWNIPSCRRASWNIPSCRRASWNIPSCRAYLVVHIGSANGFFPDSIKPYISQSWPSSMSPYGVTRPQWVNLEYSKMSYNNLEYSKMFYRYNSLEYSKILHSNLEYYKMS